MKRNVIIAILALLVGTILLLWVANNWRSRAAAMQEASLIFIGFTNLPTKGDGVILCCTNSSAKPICLSIKNYDTFSSGKWETHRLDNGDRKGGLTDEAKQWLHRFNGTPNRLGPNEAATFYVPSPETNAAWRVRFSCVEQTLGDKIRKHTIGGAELPPHAVFMNGEYFTGRTYDLLSTEIS